MNAPITSIPSTAAVPDIALANVAAPGSGQVDRKGKGKDKSRAVHHLSAGALSGFTSAIILQPLDLLKTRLQQASPSGVEEVGVKRYVLEPYRCRYVDRRLCLCLWSRSGKEGELIIPDAGLGVRSSR